MIIRWSGIFYFLFSSPFKIFVPPISFASHSRIYSYAHKRENHEKWVKGGHTDGVLLQALGAECVRVPLTTFVKKRVKAKRPNESNIDSFLKRVKKDIRLGKVIQSTKYVFPQNFCYIIINNQKACLFCFVLFLFYFYIWSQKLVIVKWIMS